jgi:heptosyltransferase-2
MTLAILPNWLGDLVMVQPAVTALRQRGPVTGVVAPGLAGLVEDCGLVDHVEVFDRRGRDRGLGGLVRAGRRLRGAREAFVFGPSLRAAALSAATGTPRRVGLGGAGREVFLTEVHRPGFPKRSLHLVDEWGGLVSTAEPNLRRCHWIVGQKGERGLAELRRTDAVLCGEFVVFAPSANYGITKEWPESAFAEVALGLRDEQGLVPVFVGSAAIGERERAASLATRTGGVDLSARTDLPTLAALFAAARLFVGNDSGPMHLAAAVATPTVGIFGSTSPAWTAPRGPRVRIVGPAPAECSPCFRQTCPFDRECLTGIGPDVVLDAATTLLAGST